MIDLGDTYTRGFEVRNASDVLTTPASNVCTLTLPDGTSTTPTLTVSSTGVLRLDYTTTQAGRHSGRLVTVNPGSAHTFTFDVDEAATGIVSLADARAHLNFTTTTNDEELRRYIDAATDFIEARIGPVVRRTIVEKLQPQDGLLFTSGPIISLTSITDTYGYGYVYTAASYLPDGSTIYPIATAQTISYPVTVTYVGGRAIVPALIQQAALDYIAWRWESQRGATALPLPGGEYETVNPATVPFKILQALEPYAMPVVA